MTTESVAANDYEVSSWPDATTSDSHATKVAALFREHNSALVSFLRARLRSEQDAREAAQEAYVKLLQLDCPGAVSFLRSYLFRIAANVATDRLRQRQVRRAHASVECCEDICDAGTVLHSRLLIRVTRALARRLYSPSHPRRIRSQHRARARCERTNGP
jgi:DNA-directed RNA polymerase specialized sigma24 family protein